MIAGIGHAGVAAIGVRPERAPHASTAAVACLRLGKFTAAGGGFDGVAIKIARAEIHVLEGASGLENVIEQADALEQLHPIDGCDEATCW